MSQSLYMTIFIGGLAICLIGALMHRTPKRPCPARTRATPLQGRRCRHCGYESRWGPS